MTARAAACICLLLLLLPSAARAGLVTDFSVRQEDDRVVFDFGVSSEAEQVRVGLLLRLGQTLLDPAELHLKGDLGEISPGPDKRIVWNVLRDFPEGLSGPLSGELRAPDLLREPVAGMRFVRVQGDCFEMGCGPWFPYCEQDEKPVHPVCPDDFLLSVTPVTRAQFAPFLNQTGRTAGDYPGLAIRDGDWVVLRDPEAPATGVSRVVAMAYAAWLSQESGRTYTLPTEAQWEYACRSGGRRFGYGTPTGRPQGGLEAQWRTPSRANLLGVEGMSGGVWEWTAGAYVSYPKPDQTDPDLNGVLRGGRDGSFVRNARCFNRYDRAPGRGDATTGFRLVAAP